MRRLPKTLGFLERKGLCQVDFQVLYTQQWLNSTYGAKTGWVHLTEDGQTGRGTIYGLRRALQVELGVTPIAEGFGPATTNAYQTKVGAISATSATAPNVLRIFNGALWCKGYAAFAMGNSAARPPTFAELAPAVALVRADLGLTATAAPATASVDVKLMARPRP